MSFTSQSLVTVATALASNQLRSFISEVDMDDLLHPLGLVRRRVRRGPSIVLLGAGAGVGAATVFLVSPAGESLRRRMKATIGNSKRREKDFNSQMEPDVETRPAETDNHQAGAALGHS